MILSYLEFKKGKDAISINFPTRLNIRRNDYGAFVSNKNIRYLESFFSPNIDFIYSIVGKNASGKTSLLKNIIDIFNNQFEGEFSVIFEDIDKITNEVECISFSSNEEIEIDNKIIKNIKYTDFFRKHSTVLLTNMVDDNDIYTAEGNTLNLSKTYLVNRSDTLSDFFYEEMERNIDFVIRYKDDAKIGDYISLPEKLNYLVEKIKPVEVNKREEFIKNIISKAKAEYETFFMEQIINSSSKVLNRLFTHVIEKNPYINYEEVEFHLLNNRKSFEINLDKLIKTFPEIISLKKAIKMKRNIYDDSSKKHKDIEAYKAFKQDMKEDSTENIFLNSKDKVTEYDSNSVEEFVEALKEWKKLLDKYSDFEQRSDPFQIDTDNIEGIIDIEYVYELNTFNSQFKNPWDDSIMYSWRNLSSGENAFLSIFSRLNSEKHNLKENVILIIDEGDMSFHPEWQQQWVNVLTNILQEVFKITKFQILVSTHSPFILSDLPNENILLLSKNNRIDTHDLKLSFGSNIQDLLAHNFFIHSGMTGNFAKHKINNTIDRLLENELDSKSLSEIKIIIDMIGEPLVRKKVHDLYIEKMNNMTNLEVRLAKLEEQIEHLKEELNGNE